ncbi:CapA family protein [Pseudoalteromonas aliena]|uniref:CapA family protein n=1 Tax=Pseudoalteromonas aliena TaxID=247523 RepID=UPI00249578C8|nr:CapA family protein [Pseudoalteromonas aliena]
MRQLFVILFVILSLNCQAEEMLNVSVKVINEEGSPLPNVLFSINGNNITSDKNGVFTVNIKRHSTYTIRLSHDDYYTSIQTFSDFELTNHKLAHIDDIILVKKKKSRTMLAFGGDVMMGRRFYHPYFGDQTLINEDNKLEDSKAIVQYIKPYMSLADYAAVNLETQIANEEPTERAPKSVTFYSKPEIVSALAWAGIDYVSLGNNHTYDYMEAGLQSTLSFLEGSKLGYSGAGVDAESALKAHLETINGIDFAMLGYVGWEGSASPTQTANDHHGGAAYGSMKNMQASITKQLAQKKIPIVQYHGSQEYANNPTGVTEQRLKSSLDAGAALAIAHHPHVAQGLELYNNKLIAYSMGNFIFDQNFSATQHSFILYVWLDDGEFHRAEIVPIYVKGYKPTPATGMHRYTVMKRLTELSKQRNTVITTSGGHGIIRSQHVLDSKVAENNAELAIHVANNERAIPIYHTPWDRKITEIKMPNTEVAYRLGTNLINGSDFESFATFDSPERGWLFEQNSTTLNDFGASGQHSLRVKLAANEPSVFGMQSFRRVYHAGSVMTLKAKFNVQAPVKINFYWQGRKKRQKLFDALNNSAKQLIGSVELDAASDWQNIELDFNSPRVGYRGYRVIAEIQLQNAGEGHINIDDFSLIEWQSAYSKESKPNYYNALSAQAAYLGINKTVSAPIIVKF